MNESLLALITKGTSSGDRGRMKPLRELRKIAKERVAELILNMSDEELFGLGVIGTTDGMSRVHNEILARVIQ